MKVLKKQFHQQENYCQISSHIWLLHQVTSFNWRFVLTFNYQNSVMNIIQCYNLQHQQSIEITPGMHESSRIDLIWCSWRLLHPHHHKRLNRIIAFIDIFLGKKAFEWYANFKKKNCWRDANCSYVVFEGRNRPEKVRLSKCKFSRLEGTLMLNTTESLCRSPN